MLNLRYRCAAWGQLLKRYAAHVVHFWGQRHAMTPPPRSADEAEFLPAALSLQASPVSPLGRWLGRLLMLLLASVLLWSVLGKMDVVVSGSGKVIPSARIKVIASVETASVTQIEVSEGQSVRAGDRLITLDARMSDHERAKAMGDWASAQLQVLRSRALLASLDANRLIRIAGSAQDLTGIAPTRIADAQAQLASQWRDFISKRDRYDGEIVRYRAQVVLIRQRVGDYRVLAESHDVSVHAWQEKRQDQAELEGKLADAEHQRSALIAETRKTAEDALSDGLKQASDADQEAQRAAAHSDLLVLTAPVDGTVQQLSAHTIGGVVAAAQPLMVIVPQEPRVEVEAFVENKDIGFIHEGQNVAVKIETFDYTQYGTLHGQVSHISHDAIDTGAISQNGTPAANPSDHTSQTEPPRAPMYAVKVLLERNAMVIDGKHAPLTPGMSVSVEIKTGSRRVIAYFLSPLIQHLHESLNER